MRLLAVASLCCLLAACGGQSNSQSSPGTGGESAKPGSAASAGAAGDSAAGASDADGGNVAAAGAPSGPAGPAPGDEGAGGAAPELPSIEPGTRICLDSRDCLGLECVGKSGQTAAMCSLPCDADEACAVNERCLKAEGLESSCVVRCDVGTECQYPFDCFDPERDGRFVCVPAPWTIQW